jgi:DNA-damage-inducible protein D
MNDQNKLTLFEGINIRKVWYNEQWYFVMNDIIEILADTGNPRQYWSKVKKKINEETQLQPIWLQLKIMASDGKNRLMDCANTEGVLRIIMSVPSPKAEPLKLWLAEQGKRSIEEAENPELGFERLKEIYKAKGRSDEWIVSRLKSIGIRKELTDEWQKRGIKEGQEYGILTATIAKNTFGLTPSEHADHKKLDKENLRDHMTNLELVFTMLGEELTRVQAVKDDAQGFNENLDAAQKGGEVAGESLRNAENKMGIQIVSSENFLTPLDTPEALPNDTTR